MSNDDLFDEFMEDPYLDEVSGSFKTIVRAKITRAYQGWRFGGEPKSFPYESKTDASLAYEQCAEYCQGDKSYPQNGMLTAIYGDDVPTHPEGAMNDWDDFVPVFHSKAKYTGRVDVQGEFPYDLVLEGLRQNRALFCEVQWCELSQKIDNVREPTRDKEKSKYPRTVYVAKRIFKSRVEAYAAAGKSPDEDDFGDFGGSLSVRAKEAGWTLETLQAQAEKIQTVISDAMAGKGTPGDEKLPEESARKFACENFVIELEDLVLMLEEVPF